MFEIFRGWKRKMGCVTLGLACLFAAGWVRSYSLDDLLQLQSSNTVYSTASYGGMISFSQETTIPNRPASPTPVKWYSIPLETIHGFRTNADGTREQYDPWDLYQMEWQRDFGGFHFGAGMQISANGIIDHLNEYIFPHWSIVIPLTLLSAWLLLSKPRQPKPQNATASP